MAADLTPELLAQLEREATEASSRGRWSGYPSPPPSPAEVLALVAAAKERDQLRAEVERLRGLGLEAVNRAEDYRDYVCNSQENAMAETKRLRAEIERKP